MVKTIKRKSSTKSRFKPDAPLAKAAAKTIEPILPLSDAMKDKLRAISGFPHIKPADWKPVACKHYKKERIRRKDPRYNQIHMFILNTKIRR